MSGTINVIEAYKMMRAGEAVLIDVREPDEFKTEHIAYALSVPLSSLEGGFALLDIPEEKTILFQCLKGKRGQMACERIDGMKQCKNNIMNIEGGIDAWKESNLPVISMNQGAAKLPIMRQVQIIVGGLVALFVILGLMGVTIFFIIAALLGGALFFAGLTGWCGLAMILSKMPWNNN